MNWMVWLVTLVSKENSKYLGSTVVPQLPRIKKVLGLTGFKDLIVSLLGTLKWLLV